MKSPFVDIKIEGETIEDVLSFRYEDAITLDNMIEFTVEGKQELIEAVNAGKFKSGLVIVFSFGYINGLQSENHAALLVDTDVKYKNTGGLELVVRGIDMGTVLKKSETTKDWSGKTSAEIAKDIAGKYGMSFEVEYTETKHESLNQCGRNDFEFLVYLALLEGGYIFYVRNNILYFVQRGLDKDSFITYNYGSDDEVLSFTTSSRDSVAKAENTATAVTAVTDDKKATEEGVTKVDISTADVNLDKFEMEYLSNTFSEHIQKQLVLPEYEKIEVVSISEGLIKETKLMILTGSLTVEGHPLLSPDIVVTLAGKLIDRDLGNWYVGKVTHKIDRAGYTTILDMAKNSTKVATSNASSNVNTSKGSSNTVADVDYITVKVYDENSELIGYKTKNGLYIDANDQAKVKQYSKKPISTGNTATVNPTSNTSTSVADNGLNKTLFNIYDNMGNLLTGK